MHFGHAFKAHFLKISIFSAGIIISDASTILIRHQLEEFEIDGMKFDMSNESAIASAKTLTVRMVLSYTTGLSHGEMVNRSFPEKEMPTILEMLITVGESSNNIDLINVITSQYKCKEPKPCAANTLCVTAEDYANLVKYLINDSTVENPFVPHTFMVNDKGLAGTIGVAKGSLPDPVLEHVAWSIGWGLQTNDEGRLITAYHSSDMNDFRAWVVIDLQNKDKKNAVVFFANAHNGDILAEQII